MKYMLLFCLCAALLSGCAQNAPMFSTDLSKEAQSAALPASVLLPSVNNDAPMAPVSPADAPPVVEEIRLSFIGDVMLAAENGDDGFWSFNLFAYDTPTDYYFAKMRDLFAADDWTVANGENVFTDDENPEKAEKSGEGYWYYSGTENAQIYADGAIEIVSLANNHALDYGIRGRDDTAAALEAVGVMPILEGRDVILEKADVKIALLCASMYSEYYLTPILDWLASTRDAADYHIVYYHGGTERVHTPDEWRVRASRAMVDAGADLVLGNHPHVLQPIEHYGGAEIVYSLGNFLFGGSHTCENRTMVYALTLTSTDGTLTGEKHEVIPCYCYGELWQPTVIENESEKEAVLAFLRGEREKPF